jgi:hypothetical protein
MIDHTRDKNLMDLHYLNKVFTIPAFVKEASIAIGDLTAEPSHNIRFADTRRKLYPTDTKADTWLSVVYFNKHASEYDAKEREQVSRRLIEAVKFWQLEDTFKPNPTQLSSKEAAATPAPFTVKFCKGDEVLDEVPVYDHADMQKLASELLQQRHMFPYETRSSVAQQLLDLNAQMGALTTDQQDLLEKTAGQYRTTVHDLAQGLIQRDDLYRRKGLMHTDELQGLLKEAVASAEHAIVQQELMQKIAGVLDDYDRFANLHARGYSPSFSAPEDMFGGITRSGAKTLVHGVINLDGELVPKTKLAKYASQLRTLLEDLGEAPAGNDEDLFRKVASLNNPTALNLVLDLLHG